MKKNTIILSLITYSFGLSLTLINILPNIRKGFQITSFGYGGLTIAFISILFGSIVMNRMGKDGVLITSKLTPLYKYYLSILIFQLFIFNTIFFLLKIYPEDNLVFLISNEILFLIWIFLIIPFMRLSYIKVYLKKNKLIVGNYFYTKEFKISDITRIRRYYIFLFKFEIMNKSIFVLPKFSESFGIFTPESIQELKNKMEKYQ